MSREVLTLSWKLDECKPRVAGRILVHPRRLYGTPGGGTSAAGQRWSERWDRVSGESVCGVRGGADAQPAAGKVRQMMFATSCDGIQLKTRESTMWRIKWEAISARP